MSLSAPAWPVLRWRDICLEGHSLHLARVSAPQPGSWQMHAHDFYECFIIEAGKGWHLVGTARFPLDPGMLIFIRPEHAHGFQAPSRNLLTLTNIAFPADLIHSFLTRHPNLPQTWPLGTDPTPLGTDPIVFRMNGSMQKRFGEIVDDLAWGGRGRLDAEFFLCALFRLISGDGGACVPQDLPDWMQNALLHMEQQENLRAGVARLVALSGRTPEHVARTFQRFLGQTPSQWINGHRIRCARRLLETTTLSITEVALECGFDNLSYFHRTFKQTLGHTPRAHRKIAGRSLGVG